MATKKPMIKVTMEPEVLAEVEEYMIQNGYPDRSMAVHELIAIALEARRNHPADPTPKIHRREKRRKGGEEE